MFRYSKKAPHLITGEYGEKLAVRYFRLRGYKILQRNYRCKLGEIDIIAQRKDTLVFIEVRSRSEPFLTDPAGTVDEIKIVRIINAAKYYLMEKRLVETPSRFDVLAISLRQSKRPVLEHLQEAFDLSSDLPDDPARRGARKQARHLSRSFPVKKKEG
ncbi:YraN family protein [bacterium]|nr:MAG: YraN family protein [bacterium]